MVLISTISAIPKKSMSYVEAYRRQLQSWLFDPINILVQKSRENDNNNDLKIAVLSLALMYFEPHGQYLTGTIDGKRQSQKLFVTGFQRFVESNNDQFDEKALNQEFFQNLYSWTRCGLMHSLTLSENIFIDTYGIGGKIISKLPISTMHGQKWLIDPVLLFAEMQNYSNRYLESIENNSDNNISTNFNKVFQARVVDKGTAIKKMLNSKK